MTFNAQYDPQTWIKHVIPDPQHGALFPYRMLAGAFGMGVEQEPALNQALGRLTSGQHYMEQLGRTFITLAGLYAIADLLGTPEGQLFKQAVMAWSQTHQPFGGFQTSLNTPTQPLPAPQSTAVKTYGSLMPTQPMPTVLTEFPVQSKVMDRYTARGSESQANPPLGGALSRTQAAHELITALRPEIERAVFAANAMTRTTEPALGHQLLLEALQWQRTSDLQLIQGVTNAQQVVADATQSSVKTTSEVIQQVQLTTAAVNESQGWRQSVELWLDGADLATLLWVGALGLPLVGLGVWLLVSAVLAFTRPSLPLTPPTPAPVPMLAPKGGEAL